MGAAGNSRFDIAVFPLPNAVLFPGTTLPLQIFEKRYAQMLKDIRARGWSLAVSLAIPSDTPDRFLLNSICGAGEVQVFKEYPDGRADILVHGQRRVQLHKFIQRHPYLVMEAEPLVSTPEEQGTEGRSLREFLALLKTWVFLNPDLEDQTALVFDAFESTGDAADFFAFRFLRKVHDKQVYLETTDTLRRVEMLSQYLETDLVRLTRKLNRQKPATIFH